MTLSAELAPLTAALGRLAPPPRSEPDASVVVPVNAQGDVENVMRLLEDLGRYAGTARLELLLVVNNFPEGETPDAVATFRALGARVVAIPNLRRPGYAVPITARMAGLREAAAEWAILLDADCRIPDATALIDWYVSQHRRGAAVAYTRVGYFELRPGISIATRIALHHLARWIKRVVLRIPTTRGSSYAVLRDLTLRLWDEGMLADDLNIGPAIRRAGGAVRYGGARQLTVLTSGRMFMPGWRKLPRYFGYRLRYNWRTLRGGGNVAQRTGREGDPVRRYVDNRPVK